MFATRRADLCDSFDGLMQSDVVPMRDDFQVLEPVIKRVAVPMMDVRPGWVDFSGFQPPDHMGPQGVATFVGTWTVRSVDEESASIVDVSVIPMVGRPGFPGTSEGSIRVSHTRSLVG